MNGQITINRIEETSVVVNWTTTTTINKLEYSTNGGSTWTQQSVVAGTGDICRIDGLEPNTEYNIVLRLSYVNGSSTTSSSTNTLTVKTYDYPYIASIGKTDLPIQNFQVIIVYNPIPRDIKINMINTDTREVLDSIEVSAENFTYITGSKNGVVTFTPNSNTLYSSIPSSTTGSCEYRLFGKNNNGTYIPSDSKSGYTYSIDYDKTSVQFSDFTYRDTNSIVANILGTNQELVKGLSQLEVTISSANKMVASQGAIPMTYDIITNITDYSDNIEYSDNDIIVNIGTAIPYGEPNFWGEYNEYLTIYARDSRNMDAFVDKLIKIYDYSEPTVEVTGLRLNNIEDETTIKINGTYSPIVKDDINKNNVTLQYRYSEIGSEVFTDWVGVTPILNNSDVTCNDIVLSLDKTKSYNVEVKITDSFGKYAINTCTIDEGKFIFFISSNKRACYINGQKIVMPFNLPVATVEDTPSYYLLAKLPAKSDSNGTLRINGFLGDRTSSFKAVIDCLIANRGSLNVTGTWYGKSSAFTYLNDIEIYEQANGEHWIYLKVKSSINGGVSLNIEGTDILSDEYSYDYVTTPSGTLAYTINDSTLIDLNTANNHIGDLLTVGIQNDITISVNTSNPVIFNKQIEKNGSSLTLQSDGGIKIGKGVSVISIIGNIYCYDGGTAHRMIGIKRNSVLHETVNYRNVPNYTHLHASKIIKVNEGDVIYLLYQQESTLSLRLKNYNQGTFLNVTVIK